jgi:hypothetical protein
MARYIVVTTGPDGARYFGTWHGEEAATSAAEEIRTFIADAEHFPAEDWRVDVAPLEPSGLHTFLVPHMKAEAEARAARGSA